MYSQMLEQYILNVDFLENIKIVKIYAYVILFFVQILNSIMVQTESKTHLRLKTKIKLKFLIQMEFPRDHVHPYPTTTHARSPALRPLQSQPPDSVRANLKRWKFNSFSTFQFQNMYRIPEFQGSQKYNEYTRYSYYIVASVLVVFWPDTKQIVAQICHRRGNMPLNVIF